MKLSELRIDLMSVRGYPKSAQRVLGLFLRSCKALVSSLLTEVLQGRHNFQSDNCVLALEKFNCRRERSSRASMNGKISKLAAIGLMLVSVAVAEPLSTPQQYSTRTDTDGPVTIGMGSQPTDRVAMLTNLLALTTSQQEDAKTIFNDEDTTTKPLIDQLKQATNTLGMAEKTAAADTYLDQLAANVANITSQILAADAKAQSKIYALLTAEQQQKLDQLPHPFFVPSAPLLPPAPIFISSTGAR